MANTTLSPNMSLPVPTVGTDPGPDWAYNLNACLSVLDGHNHSPGSGVQINPAGININTDLSFNNNNATFLRTSRYQPNPSLGALDLDCTYVNGVDLYYVDGNGNNIRITQSGSVVGSSGTITGLPSGTASASYSAGTFTFQSATSTPAAINAGPVSIGLVQASSPTVTLQANASLVSSYDVVFPVALPSSAQYVTLDNSGNISYNTSGHTGSGAVVLASSPTISSPTISAPTITGTIVFTGSTITGGTFSSPTLNTPTINNPTTAGGTISSAAMSGGSITNPTMTGGSITNTTLTNCSTSGTFEKNTGASYLAADVVMSSSVSASTANATFGVSSANNYIWVANFSGNYSPANYGHFILVGSSGITVYFGPSSTSFTVTVYGFLH